ncbi:hypothetical protein [Legionella cherrii]|uniref:hypothetical protein n=1 Tax=Legionella cherrii TaxID=28084 RepID=UPI000AAA1C1B|nr:hypothetical protein [Legionella cherrii]
MKTQARVYLKFYLVPQWLDLCHPILTQRPSSERSDRTPECNTMLQQEIPHYTPDEGGISML